MLSRPGRSARRAQSPLALESLEPRHLLAAVFTEGGVNDFRISEAVGDAIAPAIAYNSTNDQYLVVWAADGDPTPGKFEIFGQILASDGTVAVQDFKISNIPNGADFDALNPAVVYNATNNHYLVVWQGALAVVSGDPEEEIFGQILGADGSTVLDDFRISDAGDSAGANSQFRDARNPSVAWDSTHNQYLVVWEADDTDFATTNNEEFEIYGQLLAGNGAEIGVDFRISDVGIEGNDQFDAREADVAYNSTTDQFLVVWHANEQVPLLSDPQFEVYGQRLQYNGSFTLLTDVGVNDFRISDAGVGGPPEIDASQAKVVYNATQNEWFVVWQADANGVDGDIEIFAQRISASGSLLAPIQVQISDSGAPGDGTRAAFNPSVAFNSLLNEYLIVWQADDSDAGLNDNEFEIFGQRVSFDAVPLGTNDFQLSDAGGLGELLANVSFPAVAFSTATGGYIAVWQADDTDSPGVNNDDFEIFGQRIDQIATADPADSVLVVVGGGQIRVLDAANGSELFSFLPFDAYYGDIRITTGDVNFDTIEDFIVATGHGVAPQVKVYSGVDGSLLQSFLAYDAAFLGGVFVAAGDIDGDGFADIITGAGSGGGPHVKVFSGLNGNELMSFFAYDPAFAGGVQVAVGDIDGNSVLDIITGAGAGGGPHVKVFSGVDGSELRSFFAYDPAFTGGVFVSAGNFNGDLADDIITGAGAGGGPHVRVLDGLTLTELASFFAFDPAFTGGVRVAAGEVTGDTVADIAVAAGPGGGPHVKVLDGTTFSPVAGSIGSFYAFVPGFTGGVFVSLSGSGSPLQTLALGPGSVSVLTTEALASAVTQAKALLGSPNALEGVRFHIADLPGTRLGLASGQNIWIDTDAAGWGWALSEEQLADGDRIDLLTAVLHEMGHILGWEHALDATTSDLMDALLAPGERKLLH